ncbi:hypothetical protein [Streptomyces yunnanensis]|uniref:hypothetical protein n=1 Tax=Streptomyces yunnanensis TaxID=156453 RepID=UPI003D9C207F
MSVEYPERLEQGQNTNPSGAVLTALADVLRLSLDEKWSPPDNRPANASGTPRPGT